MPSSVVGAVAGGVVNSYFAKKGAKRARKNADKILPPEINTGNSIYNTKSGEFSLDPSVRAGQDRFLSNVGGLKSSINQGFDQYKAGLGDLKARTASMREQFVGNESAYRESLLNPINERIAKAEGNLDRELKRTEVRGTFANQAKANFQFEAGKTLRDAEAKIENERINKLGDFMGMDADILKAGLASDTGRINMLQSLEQSLEGISMDRFNQEMQMLGLPGTLTSGTTAQANIRANADGVRTQAGLGLAGDVIGAIGNIDFGGTPNMDSTGWTDTNGYGVG